LKPDLPKESSVQFMHARFTIGVIAGFSWFTLAFKAAGAESPGPDFSTLSRDSRGSSSSRENAVAYYNRAIHYGNKRDYKLAIRDATAAIQLNPKYANAYHNRGAFHADIGEFDKAIADLSEAIRLNPRSATTFDGRAQVYEDIEKFNKAVADYDRVIRIIPKDADDYAVRGRAYFKKGNYKEAASAFEKALQLSPNNDSALGRLALFRATCPDASLRNGKEAIRMSMRACELSKWKEPYRIEALAAAYAETGDFDKAVKYQTQAINMKSAYGPVDKKTREHLMLYQAHKPARIEPLVVH
jgi:tetratricopeptide (TPR) repeat protein